MALGKAPNHRLVRERGEAIPGHDSPHCGPGKHETDTNHGHAMVFSDDRYGVLLEAFVNTLGEHYRRITSNIQRVE